MNKPHIELEQRSALVQLRSVKRHEHILLITAGLLEEVGLSHLNTKLIAKRAGISVGALYHYFPNKHAILYAIAQKWLDDALEVLEQLRKQNIKTLGVAGFVDFIMDAEIAIYRKQRGLMPLIEAMHTIPELRALSDEHDALVLTIYPIALRQLGINVDEKELRRIAHVFYEITYPLLLLASQQSDEAQTDKMMLDLKHISVSYLENYIDKAFI